MKSEGTHNITSLQDAEDGQLPSGWQVGQTKDLFGLEAAPANHLAPQGSKKAKQTSATSGLFGSSLSASADLQSYLASRLAAQLPTGGLTMFSMIWKQKATPAGRQYCQLAVLASRTKEIDCGLWGTPNTMDGIGDRSLEAMERQFQTTRKGRTAPANLREQVNPAMWPTATATMRKDCPTKRAERGKKYGFGAAWTLPMLTTAMWVTPSARDWKDSQGMRKTGKDGRNRQDQLPRHGYSAQTENQGQLNPEFVCWLMGFPAEHLNCAPTAMPSSRKSRRRS